MQSPALAPEAMKLTQARNHDVGFCSAILEPLTNRLLVGTIAGRILAIDPPSLESTGTFVDGHRGYVHLLAALPTLEQVVSAGSDRRIVWWQARDAHLIRELELPARPLGMSVSPDGTQLALVGDDLLVRIVNATDGNQVGKPLEGHPPLTEKTNPSTIYAVAWSPDGTLLASGDRTGTILVHDAATGTRVHTFAAGRFYSNFNKQPDGTTRVAEYELGGVRSLLFTADGTHLVAGGMDQYNPTSAGIDGPMGLLAFTLSDAKEAFAVTLDKGKGYIQNLQEHASGKLLAAGGGGAPGSGLGTLVAIDRARPDQPVIHEREMTIRGMALASDQRAVWLAGMLKVASVGIIEAWSLPAEAEATKPTG